MTPQEAAEQYANEHWGDNYITENKAHDEKAFIAGQQWQFEVVSSALKEIAELTRWKNEMLQLWNKLDAYLQTRNDTRLGESKIDFVIKVMKEQEALQRVRDLLKNSDRLSPESHSEPNSANLPPESAS